MPITHRDHVQSLLDTAATDHAGMLARLPAALSESLPVDAQGITQAIDHLATEAGLTATERRDLVRPHAVNPAVMHARVYGHAPMSRGTVIGSFVEAARVRADALAALGDLIGGRPLGQEVRALLIEHPPPLDAEASDAVGVLRATYEAHEQAVIIIASRLDDS